METRKRKAINLGQTSIIAEKFLNITNTPETRTPTIAKRLRKQPSVIYDERNEIPEMTVPETETPPLVKRLRKTNVINLITPENVKTPPKRLKKSNVINLVTPEKVFDKLNEMPDITDRIRETPINPRKRANSLNSNKIEDAKMRKFTITLVDFNNTDKRVIDETVSPPSTTKELNLIEKFQDVLGKHYMNSVSRLNMVRRPKCFMSMVECASNHSKDSKEKPIVLDIQLKKNAHQLLAMDHPVQFLKIMSDLNCQHIFPGDDILQSLLELILTINEQSDENKTYVVEHIIHKSITAFDDTLQVFPPCWHPLRSEYQNLLSNPVSIENLKKFGAERGIFFLCLSILEDCLERDDYNAENEKTPVEDIEDFYLWEQENCQKYDFFKNTREMKLDRIFIILNLLIKLMENDLCMWMIRHPKNNMSNRKKISKQPLIAGLIWSDGDTNGAINYNVKNILTIFVNCVSLNFPSAQLDILSRLLNLIAVTINISEITSPDGITYPSIKAQTKCFAAEIKAIIKKSNYYDLQLYRRVIEYIKTPMIKMLMIDELLNTFNRHPGPLTLKKIFQNLRKERWLECESKNLATVQSTGGLAGVLKYPMFDGTIQFVKQNDIYQDEYVHILLLCFQAYLEVFRIHELIYNSIPNTIDSENPKVVSNQKKDTFNFAEIITELNIVVPVNIQTEIPVSKAPTNTIFTDIMIDEINCREDVKYFLYLRDLMNLNILKYGDIFNNWVSYISSLNL